MINFIVEEYTSKKTSKGCNAEDQYGKYNSLGFAKRACSIDPYCVAVNLKGCSRGDASSNEYSLCPWTANFNTDTTSCIYAKQGISIVYIYTYC